MYLGFSPDHSSLVSNVMNLKSGFVSPQYHVVIDDLFTTVPNAEQGGLYDPITFDADRWASLLETGYERHLDADPATWRRQNGPNGPTLADDWLTGPERRVRRVRRAAKAARKRIQQLERRRQRLDFNRQIANSNQGGGNAAPPQTQTENQETQTDQNLQNDTQHQGADPDNPVLENDSDENDSDFNPLQRELKRSHKKILEKPTTTSQQIRQLGNFQHLETNQHDNVCDEARELQLGSPTSTSKLNGRR